MENSKNVLNNGWSTDLYFYNCSHFITDVVMETLGHWGGIEFHVIEYWTTGVHYDISIMIFIVIKLVHSIGGRCCAYRKYITQVSFLN